MDEQLKQTAPVFPWEIALRNATIFYQRLPGGGMQMKFAPLVGTENGLVPLPPGVTIDFSADGWERFKGEVERDGEVSSVFVPPAGAMPRVNGDLSKRDGRA